MVHLMPHFCGVSDAAKAHMESMDSYGLSTSKILGYMSGIAGGYSLLGFTKKDPYNHIDRKKRENVADGDTNSTVIAYLRGKFCAGYRTTLRYEGLNSHVKKFLSSRHAILELEQNLEVFVLKKEIDAVGVVNYVAKRRISTTMILGMRRLPMPTHVLCYEVRPCARYTAKGSSHTVAERCEIYRWLRRAGNQVVYTEALKGIRALCTQLTQAVGSNDANEQERHEGCVRDLVVVRIKGAPPKCKAARKTNLPPRYTKPRSTMLA
ncbi:hypothetical protein Ahy_B10g105129 [Arachis hypogaea]|uniref:Uncharacterized protein n=1 Tax=Arachis hypogaea TaxID=3818 RepID=A0A444X781_ARAHY|nr:hypothetical protein Ahy_B10g105129 [Arachis hypogaea]